jgi:hypothetical protein
MKVKKITICNGCYWASPSDYQRVAMVEARRADIVWLDKDVKRFDPFRQASQKASESVQDGIKRAVARSLE